MNLNGFLRPDLDMVLGGLKDFQRDTVEYVFQRLYTDADRVSKFLIADEVGLGKTLVARGVIAKAVDYLWDTVPRIDVIYICSNQSIAQQNIDRLNITANRQFQFASRATLLPITLQELRGNKMNFISLTPGTSFDVSGATGQKRERAVLFFLLREYWQVNEGTLRNVLRGDVYRDNWKSELAYVHRMQKFDPELQAAFFKQLDTRPELRQEYEALAAKIGSRRKNLTPEMRLGRNRFVGEIRRLLARSSLHALEPDLIILDEFQRFRHLFDEEHSAGLLAQALFGFENARVLLLSATPYKMYTVQGEPQEDHYRDFIDTMKFLLGEQDGTLLALENAVNQYRQALVQLQPQAQALRIKSDIEQLLRRVMVRTERLAASVDRNGLLAETFVAQDKVEGADLEGYVCLDKVAQALNAGDQVEYWKSAAYPLNLMDDYQLKREFRRALESHSRDELRAALLQAEEHLLHWQTIQAYAPLDLANARLRALAEKSLATHNWQLLWLPPTLPYYQPGSPFDNIGSEGYTKTLVFSAWRLVPKSIALLLSYEAERRMLGEMAGEFAYQDLVEKRRPLLNFTVSRERLTGMPVFCLMYPSVILAQEIDPLALALELQSVEPPPAQLVFAAAKNKLERLLNIATEQITWQHQGRADERWYWIALALLDRRFAFEQLQAWFVVQDEAWGWNAILDREINQNTDEDTVGEARRFREHVVEFIKAFEQQFEEPLGPQPEDLSDVLTYVALSSPAVVAMRGLLRLAQPQTAADWSAHLHAAAGLGAAFRSLFNQPESIALLQGRYEDSPYWGKVLHYAFAGNLQAVMDEYLHVLRESLGLLGHTSSDTVSKLSEAVQTALTLRAPTLSFDEIILSQQAPPTLDKHRVRCRYALPFGDDRDASDEYTRSSDVRLAFNSPFRPFVLATTSIGQEGLDFHLYCHRVMHWNLPSNPVDLEQREGRVHRYKGHVIRRNLVQKYNLSSLQGYNANQDLWEILFALAIQERGADTNDLVPFWIYEVEGRGFKIEREVPVLPLSREIGRMAQLKQALAIYRAVIGQPRQQELVEFLSRHMDTDVSRAGIADLVVDLSPPKRLE